MTRIFRKFIELPASHKWVLTEAVLFLFVAKFLLLILPVKTLMKINLSSKKTKIQPEENLLKQIKWALYSADRLSLWKNRCLVQSIAGRWMLNRRGISFRLVFGVKHDEEKKMIAHAWLISHNVEIIEKRSDYSVLLEVEH